MAITKTTVTGPILDTTGAAYTKATLVFTPSAPFGDDAGDTVLAQTPVEVTPDPSTGAFSVDLAPSDTVSYSVSLRIRVANDTRTYRIGLVYVPASGPVALEDLLPIFAPNIPTNAELLAALSAAVASAEAAAGVAEAAEANAEGFAVSAEAAAADSEAARDTAQSASLAVGTFDDTTAFLAGSSDGDFGWVVTGDFLTWYKNVAGTATAQTETMALGDQFEVVRIPASMLAPVSNVALSLQIDRRVPYWKLPKASTVYLGIVTRVPAHWSTFSVQFELLSIASDTGDASLSAGRHEWVEGDSVDVFPAGLAVAATMPTANNITKFALTGALSVDPSKRMSVRISRNNGSGSDTYASDIGLIGINLVKVS